MSELLAHRRIPGEPRRGLVIAYNESNNPQPISDVSIFHSSYYLSFLSAVIFLTPHLASQKGDYLLFVAVGTSISNLDHYPFMCLLLMMGFEAV